MTYIKLLTALTGLALLSFYRVFGTPYGDRFATRKSP